MLNARLGVLVATLAGLCMATGCDGDVQGGTAGTDGTAGQAGGAGEIADAGPDSDAGQLPAEASHDASADVSPDVSPDPSLPSGVIQVLTIDDFHGQLEPLAIMTGEEVTWYGGLG